MMELELQFDAFLDSPYFPLSLAENRLAVFYNNDQLFGVCTRKTRFWLVRVTL